MKATSKISDRDLNFQRRLTRSRIYSELIAHYVKMSKTSGLKKHHLAALLGKDRAQITRLLSEPSNLTLDTISDLLLAMDAELEVQITPVSRDHVSMEDFMTAFAQIGQSRISGNVIDFRNSQELPPSGTVPTTDIQFVMIDDCDEQAAI